MLCYWTGSVFIFHGYLTIFKGRKAVKFSEQLRVTSTNAVLIILWVSVTISAVLVRS